MADKGFNGSKVALFLGDRMLVTLRDDRPGIPWPAHWDFPGGGREGTETPWQTLSREVEEEVGLDLAGAEVLWRLRAASPPKEGAVVWFYVARLPGAAVRELLFGDEGTAWALLAPDRVLRLAPIVPHLPPRLELYSALSGGWGAAVPGAAWD